MTTDWGDLERTVNARSSVWRQELDALRSIFAGCPEDIDGTLIFALLNDDEDGLVWCVEFSAVRYTRCTSNWLHRAIEQLLTMGSPVSLPAGLIARCMTALTLLSTLSRMSTMTAEDS